MIRSVSRMRIYGIWKFFQQPEFCDADDTHSTVVSLFKKNGEIVRFTIARTTQMRRIMNAYCNFQSFDVTSIVFLWDGRRIRGYETADEDSFCWSAGHLDHDHEFYAIILMVVVLPAATILLHYRANKLITRMSVDRFDNFSSVVQHEQIDDDSID